MKKLIEEGNINKIRRVSEESLMNHNSATFWALNVQRNPVISSKYSSIQNDFGFGLTPDWTETSEIRRRLPIADDET